MTPIFHISSNLILFLCAYVYASLSFLQQMTTFGLPRNAVSSMKVTEAGITTLPSFRQFANAVLRIAFVPSGSLIVESSSQPSKHERLNASTLPLKMTCESLVFLLNA